MNKRRLGSHWHRMGHGMCYFPTNHLPSYYQLLSRLQGIIPALFQLFPLWHLEYSRGSAEVQVAEGQRSNLMGVSQNWGYPTSAISNILVNHGIFGFQISRQAYIVPICANILNLHVGFEFARHLPFAMTTVRRLRWSLSIERAAKRITPPPKIPSLPPWCVLPAVPKVASRTHVKVTVEATPSRKDQRLPHFKFSNCLAFAYLHCLHSDPKLKKPEATTSVSLDFRTTTFFEKEFYRKSIQILWWYGESSFPHIHCSLKNVQLATCNFTNFRHPHFLKPPSTSKNIQKHLPETRREVPWCANRATVATQCRGWLRGARAVACRTSQGSTRGWPAAWRGSKMFWKERWSPKRWPMRSDLGRILSNPGFTRLMISIII